MQYRRLVGSITTLLLLNYCVLPIYAMNFNLPAPDMQIVGDLRWVQALDNDSFNSIGRRYGLGYHEIMEANPGVSSVDIAAGTIIVLPTRFILPPGVRKGIVVNLSELRLYCYNKNKVYTYPIGIGREAWDTPLGYSRIIEKLKNPTWHVPRSIREASKKDGIILPEKVPPGDDNPLGPYALRLHYHNYLIHGTNDVEGVGRRSTAGCLRMFPEDAKQLFSQVSIGSPVNIIDQPYKAGWDANYQLCLEAHLPLQPIKPEEKKSQNMLKKVISSATHHRKIVVAWDKAQAIIHETSGIPQKINITSPTNLCVA